MAIDLHIENLTQRGLPMPRVNDHHLFFPAAAYSSVVERTFRELPCLQLPIDRAVHSLLHDLHVPPAKPSQRQMLKFILRHKSHECACATAKVDAVHVLSIGQRWAEDPAWRETLSLGCLWTIIDSDAVNLLERSYQLPLYGSDTSILDQLYYRHRLGFCSCAARSRDYSQACRRLPLLPALIGAQAG